MRIQLITPVLAAMTLVIFACEKENPTTPQNTPPVPEQCSFCLGEVLTLDSNNNIQATGYAQQVPFLKNGQFTGLSPIASETPTGFYGYQGGVSIAFDGSALNMVCVPNTLTFVHARVTSNTNDIPALVNVQLPGTPLISTIPDSLNIFLNPYGYTVQNFFGPGQVFMSPSGANTTGVVDSIIITGPAIGSATIGADLFESELRSFCISNN